MGAASPLSAIAQIPRILRLQPQTLLPLHKPGWQLAAAYVEFLVLGAVAFDELEERGGGLVELLDEILVWDGDGLGGYYFGVCGVILARW